MIKKLNGREFLFKKNDRERKKFMHCRIQREIFGFLEKLIFR